VVFQVIRPVFKFIVGLPGTDGGVDGGVTSLSVLPRPDSADVAKRNVIRSPSKSEAGRKNDAPATFTGNLTIGARDDVGEWLMLKGVTIVCTRKRVTPPASARQQP